MNDSVLKPKDILKIMGLLFITFFISLMLFFFVFKPTCYVNESKAITSIGLPDFMVSELKEWNKNNLNEIRIEIDSCSYAERIDVNSWNLILGEC